MKKTGVLLVIVIVVVSAHGQFSDSSIIAISPGKSRTLGTSSTGAFDFIEEVFLSNLHNSSGAISVNVVYSDIKIQENNWSKDHLILQPGETLYLKFKVVSCLFCDDSVEIVVQSDQVAWANFPTNIIPIEEKSSYNFYSSYVGPIFVSLMIIIIFGGMWYYETKVSK